MSELYERIMLHCRMKGITGGKMCSDLHLSRSLLTDLKMGRKQSISAVTASKIANYFGTTSGYLLGDDSREDPVIREYMSLPEAYQNAAATLIHILYEKCQGNGDEADE